MEKADGLDNCRKLLTMAKAGRYNGYLLEGMACPGGCIAGAGTVQPIAKTAKAINDQMNASSMQHASTSGYADILETLEERDTQIPAED